jgi:hypothetical protein
MFGFSYAIFRPFFASWLKVYWFHDNNNNNMHTWCMKRLRCANYRALREWGFSISHQWKHESIKNFSLVSPTLSTIRLPIWRTQARSRHVGGCVYFMDWFCHTCPCFHIIPPSLINTLQVRWIFNINKKILISCIRWRTVVGNFSLSHFYSSALCAQHPEWDWMWQYNCYCVWI